MSFVGTFPYGTDGGTDVSPDVSGAVAVSGSLTGLDYWLTTDSYISVRSINSYTELKRITAAIGSGSIPISGGGQFVALILDKNGVAIDSSIGTINFVDPLLPTSSPAGQGNVGLAYAGSAGNFGVGTFPARSDHAHTLPVFPAGTIVGTTDIQTLTLKTLTTPTIGDFSNAQHTHGNGVQGGALAGLNPTVFSVRGYDGSVTAIAVSNTVLANVTALTGSPVLLNGVVYDCSIMCAIEASAPNTFYIGIAAQINAVAGTTIREGTVGGQRTLFAVFNAVLTGTGAIVSVGMQAFVTGGSGTLNSGSMLFTAIPRT